MTRPARSLPTKKHLGLAAALLVLCFLLGIFYLEHLDGINQRKLPASEPSSLIGDAWSDGGKSKTENAPFATTAIANPTSFGAVRTNPLQPPTADDETPVPPTNAPGAPVSVRSSAGGTPPPPEILPAPPSLTAGITNAPVIPPGQNRAY